MNGPQRTLVKSVRPPRNPLPAHTPGLRVGLFGGTFNPPHASHRAVSLLALKKLGLDRVWWLVTPGNPLKSPSGLPPVAERIAESEKLANHPRIAVTGVESVIGTQYSHDTIKWLLGECPGVRFVWIMGADNLKGFHRWKNWREIFMLVPIAVVDRGGLSLQATSGPAAHRFARTRIAESQARTLPDRNPPAWVYLHGIKSTLSSTALREAKKRMLGG
ncbi:MAG: Nicotinate-nucleotide adenylyltransferase [Pseudorhodoplanes sp.]|nr:Nicotinate-nucleotide adenylyltransferase [Pseudorhodoplanes sp.]GIK81211.1 MAG: putative nicotinate-nucleotide adenylyltransferase [Alphaproteobacteria bacterium]